MIPIHKQPGNVITNINEVAMATFKLELLTGGNDLLSLLEVR